PSQCERCERISRSAAHLPDRPGLAGPRTKGDDQMTSVMDPVPRITAPEPTCGGAPSHSPPDTRYAPGLGAARGLGWFSIGLGLAELVAPRTMAELTGVRSPGLLQLYGLREIACGVGILSSTR